MPILIKPFHCERNFQCIWDGERFLPCGLPEGGPERRGGGAAVAPAAPRALQAASERSAGAGCSCVSARWVHLGEKLFSCAKGRVSGHYPHLDQVGADFHTVSLLLCAPLGCLVLRVFFSPPQPAIIWAAVAVQLVWGSRWAGGRWRGCSPSPGRQQRELGGGNRRPGAGRKWQGGRKEKEIFLKFYFISCLVCRKSKACEAQRAAGSWCTKKTRVPCQRVSALGLPRLP